MGVFKLGKMTFGSLFKKPETVLYPVEKKPQPLGLKGHIELDVDLCILCGMCEKSCPTDCIAVDKTARTWSIMPLQCIQCGYCVQVCPKDCLAMDPNYWSATTERGIRRIEVPEAAKAAPKAAPAAEQAPAKAQAEPEPTKAAEGSSDSAPEPSGVKDKELEEKLAMMDPSRAEAVRKALSQRM